jgi:hypothetical protein
VVDLYWLPLCFEVWNLFFQENYKTYEVIIPSFCNYDLTRDIEL